MFSVKKIMAKFVVEELQHEIRRYQDLHSDAYIRASKAESDHVRKIADEHFDETLAKLEALYELKGELRAKGYL